MSQSQNSWTFKGPGHPEKLQSSHREKEEFLCTEKENLQNKSAKKVPSVMENSSSNFLSPDQDKLARIFEGKKSIPDENGLLEETKR